jgi:hypothetical protein
MFQKVPISHLCRSDAIHQQTVPHAEKSLFSADFFSVAANSTLSQTKNECPTDKKRQNARQMSTLVAVPDTDESSGHVCKFPFRFPAPFALANFCTAQSACRNFQNLQFAPCLY